MNHLEHKLRQGWALTPKIWVYQKYTGNYMIKSVSFILRWKTIFFLNVCLLLFSWYLETGVFVHVCLSSCLFHLLRISTRGPAQAKNLTIKQRVELCASALHTHSLLKFLSWVDIRNWLPVPRCLSVAFYWKSLVIVSGNVFSLHLPALIICVISMFHSQQSPCDLLPCPASLQALVSSSMTDRHQTPQWSSSSSKLCLPTSVPAHKICLLLVPRRTPGRPCRLPRTPCSLSLVSSPSRE